jgi:catechol 2,3-dioxygenase-like lactoylglutathione lyase family enzyme
MRKAAILALALALAGCASGPVETVSGPIGVAPPARLSDEHPTAVRRTTIIVADIDRSLKLYRDVLGLKVNYDAAITVSGPAFTQNGPPRPVRLVLLNGAHDWIGWIGLLQYTDEPVRHAGPPPPYLAPGSHVIVTAVKDAKTACEKAAALEGVRITLPLNTQTYPGRNGGPPISVIGCQLFDADGAYLELNQPAS